MNDVAAPIAEATASLSEFADILGVRPSRVTRLKQTGRLVLTADGKRVLVEASKARIKETESGQPQHAASRRHWQEHREGAHDAPPAPNNPQPPEDGGNEPAANTRSYWERREAAARAETREIELAKLKGDLVETSAVRASGTEAGTVLRAALENLPDQVAPILAEGDPEREERIRARLTEHVGLVLTEISDKLKALTEQPTETPA